MLPADEDPIATAQYLLEAGTRGKITEQDSENVAWICEEFLNQQRPIKHPDQPMRWRILFGQCWDSAELHRLLDPISMDLILANKGEELLGYGFFIGTYESIKKMLKDRHGWSIVCRSEPYDLYLPEIP